MGGPGNQGEGATLGPASGVTELRGASNKPPEEPGEAARLALGHRRWGEADVFKRRTAKPRKVWRVAKGEVRSVRRTEAGDL